MQRLTSLSRKITCGAHNINGSLPANKAIQRLMMVVTPVFDGQNVYCEKDQCVFSFTLIAPAGVAHSWNGIVLTPVLTPSVRSLTQQMYSNQLSRALHYSPLEAACWVFSCNNHEMLYVVTVQQRSLCIFICIVAGVA